MLFVSAQNVILRDTVGQKKIPKSVVNVVIQSVEKTVRKLIKFNEECDFINVSGIGVATLTQVKKLVMISM